MSPLDLGQTLSVQVKMVEGEPAAPRPAPGEA
jgi:hypothetical protein